MSDILVNGRPIESLKVVELREALEERGLSKVGIKVILQGRLREAMEAERQEDEDSSVDAADETVERNMAEVPIIDQGMDTSGDWGDVEMPPFTERTHDPEPAANENHSVPLEPPAEIAVTEAVLESPAVERFVDNTAEKRIESEASEKRLICQQQPVVDVNLKEEQADIAHEEEPKAQTTINEAPSGTKEENVVEKKLSDGEIEKKEAPSETVDIRAPAEALPAFSLGAFLTKSIIRSLPPTIRTNVVVTAPIRTDVVVPAPTEKHTTILHVQAPPKKRKWEGFDTFEPKEQQKTNTVDTPKEQPKEVESKEQPKPNTDDTPKEQPKEAEVKEQPKPNTDDTPKEQPKEAEVKEQRKPNTDDTPKEAEVKIGESAVVDEANKVTAEDVSVSTTEESAETKDGEEEEDKDVEMESAAAQLANEIEVAVPKEMMQLEIGGFKEDSCLLCELTFTEPAMATAHYAGKKHAHKVNQYVRGVYQTMGIDPVRFLLNEHKAKRKRSDSEEGVDGVDGPAGGVGVTDVPDGEEDKYQFSCFLCKLYFQSEEEVEVHVQTLAHKKLAATYAKKSKYGAGDDYEDFDPDTIDEFNPDLYCRVCEKQLNSVKQYEEHRISTKHTNKKKMKTEEMAFMANRRGRGGGYGGPHPWRGAGPMRGSFGPPFFPPSRGPPMHWNYGYGPPPSGPWHRGGGGWEGGRGRRGAGSDGSFWNSVGSWNRSRVPPNVADGGMSGPNRGRGGGTWVRPSDYGNYGSGPTSDTPKTTPEAPTPLGKVDFGDSTAPVSTVPTTRVTGVPPPTRPAAVPPSQQTAADPYAGMTPEQQQQYYAAYGGAYGQNYAAYQQAYANYYQQYYSQYYSQYGAQQNQQQAAQGYGSYSGAAGAAASSTAKPTGGGWQKPWQ